MVIGPSIVLFTFGSGALLALWYSAYAAYYASNVGCGFIADSAYSASVRCYAVAALHMYM